LAKVYINLIDQKEPTLDFTNDDKVENNLSNSNIHYFKKVIVPSKDEISKHQEYLKNYLKKNNFN